MPKGKNKVSKAIPDQYKKNLKIYPPRKEQDFVKIDRELHPFYASMFEKNGAVLSISASPGSGKTSFISNILGRDEYLKDLFDAGIYICSPTINNDIGSGVLKAIATDIQDEYSEEYARNLFKLLIDDDEDEDSNGLSAILFDDCMGAFKQTTFVGKMCSMCRHMKSLIIFSNQRTIGIPANIRANISHTITFATPSQREFAHMVEFHSAFGGEQNWIDMYNDACSVRYGMLLCDFRNMVAYKQIPSTGEIVELYRRYNEDGSINDINFSKKNNNDI